jgi:hypothetical protein
MYCVLSKHHMLEQNLLHLTLDSYLSGSSFCRQNLQRVCLCIFIKKDKCFDKIDISHHCKAQDLEICKVQQETKTPYLIILSLYKSSVWDDTGIPHLALLIGSRKTEH